MEGESRGRLPEVEVLLKKAKGRMAADLIRQLTEISDVYRFQNYLVLPNIQDLRKTDYLPAVQLLTLFSSGTYKVFAGNTGAYPSLSNKQVFNLRCLSLASLAKRSSSQKISFRIIEEELGLGDQWQVFDFLIEALNYGYIKGKIDEAAQMLYVEDFVTRDIEPDDEKMVKAKLTTFMMACQNTMEKLKSETARVEEFKKQAEAQKKQIDNKIENVKGSMGDDHHMVADELYRPRMENVSKFFRSSKPKSASRGGSSKMGRY
ncbi:COP9 signalosome complex subunit 7a-like [Paramacrobiotus metropolitanus]|uniref:COP9 signalosome complex subunit 7a-like n=1 Tax=Paramacrobiotus metropolitanus TaxID=2943436 RepID=UPI0024457FDA|nr:COP9 signalosome complex subunit 7a-like [Paramacrobiotus metropolitanus]